MAAGPNMSNPAEGARGSANRQKAVRICPRSTKTRKMMAGMRMFMQPHILLAAPQGFEPQYADPESAVLPLNEGAVRAIIANAHDTCAPSIVLPGQRQRQSKSRACQATPHLKPVRDAAVRAATFRGLWNRVRMKLTN